MSPATLKFKVERSKPELITPAKPTPREFKPLSDLDDQDTLRFHIPLVHFYPFNASMNGLDPVKVIRKATAEALVYYYPIAGRLREVGPSRKLIVECTGEGILFVEADADVTLEQFGSPLVPPFPCFDQLLFDVPSSSVFLNAPLLLIQVTRLKCGGFTLAYSMNHTISDATGMFQFIYAIGEMAKGATSPSILPTWKRHVLNSRNPPRLTSLPSEYNTNDASYSIDVKDMLTDLCYKSFFFGPSEISTLRKYFHDIHNRNSSSFDIISACVLKCRVLALQPHPEEEMGLIRIVSLRTKFKDLKIPDGYYGNAAVYSLSTSTAKEILTNPLRVVQNLMNKVTEEYVRSVIDLMVIENRRPRLPLSMKYYIESNMRYVGFEKVDFGWGKAVYGGPAICSPFSGIYMPFKDGVLLPLCLPKQAMERFVKEMKNMSKVQPLGGGDNNVFKSKI